MSYSLSSTDAETMETTLRRRVADRLSHRCGPVEVDALPGGEEIRVQRCLRCDKILWTSGPSGPPAFGVGERVKLDRRCPGLIE